MTAIQQILLAAGNQAWTPAYLSPKFWLNDDSSLIISGGLVSQWNDLSGNSCHFSSSTATPRPLPVPAGLNGRRIIRFDGTDDVLTSPGAADLAFTNNIASAWAFVVYKMNTTNAVNRYLLNARVVASANSRFLVYAGMASGANIPGMGVRRLDADAFASLNGSGTTGTSATALLIRMEYASGAAYVHINGNSPTSNLALTSAGNTSATNNQVFQLGAGNTAFSNVDIGEIAFGVGALSPGDITNIFAYSSSRWAVP